MEAWWNGYVGLPFLANGRDRRGIDCWGLDRLVYMDKLGIYLHSFAGSYEVVNGKIDDQVRLRDEVLQGWKEVTHEQHKEFDLLIFTLGGNPLHTALVTKPGEMLHIMEGCDAIVESYVGRGWQRRLEGVYRYER